MYSSPLVIGGRGRSQDGEGSIDMDEEHTPQSPRTSIPPGLAGASHGAGQSVVGADDVAGAGQSVVCADDVARPVRGRL